MESKKLTQKKQVLAHLQTGKSITPLEALNLFGAFRLGAIIFELRKYHFITATRAKGKSRYAIYKLQQRNID